MINGMKGKHMVVIVAALMLLASCGTRIPTQTKLGEAKLGPKPSRDVAVEASIEWLRSHFPQEDLSRVTFGGIKPGFYADAWGGDAADRFAWVLIASVDAKNDYDLYEGAKPYHFYFLGSEFVGCEYRDTYKVTEMNGGGLTGVQVGIRPDHRRPPGM